MSNRVKASLAAVAVAGVALFAGIAPSSSDPASTASCVASSYDGNTLAVTCAVPQATLTVAGPTTVVPGPTVTAAGPTVTVSAGPPMPAGWTRTTFYDDFSAGLGKWNVRNNSWASNELSIDTNRGSNVVVGGSGLVLQAQREQYTVGSTTRQYTSGYLDTIGKFSQQFGRWEMRARLPSAKGLWPAFWLRNDAGLGELDIVESVGGTGKTVQTVHQSTNGDLEKRGHEDSGVADLTAWHTYAVEREPGVVRWFIDDRLVFTVTTASASWLDTALNSALNIRLNLQVGGSMPNYYRLPVDASTPLPAGLAVAWVRVLQR